MRGLIAIPTLTASVLGGRADHLAGYLEFENCGTEPVNSTDGKVRYEFRDCEGPRCRLTYTCLDDEQFEKRKEVQNASVVCRGVINKACCGLNRRWLLENSFGLDDEGLKHLGEAQMCHKRIDKCEVGHLEGDNFSLYCIDGDGNRCQTSDGKVSIGCQCKFLCNDGFSFKKEHHEMSSYMCVNDRWRAKMVRIEGRKISSMKDNTPCH
ncbi:unnamed protein product [Oikopleura dioica]|uniref:Sushi domain-containing protein n=1 Tax=Oikopleura dioica TaxID=34765 RepID=E4XJ24_OIKDI|nr:unnamed protein product [Oikopleura dioica]